MVGRRERSGHFNQQLRSMPKGYFESLIEVTSRLDTTVFKENVEDDDRKDILTPTFTYERRHALEGFRSEGGN